MKKILHIIASLSGEQSSSTKLGKAIIDKLQRKYRGSTVVTHALTHSPYPHLEGMHLAAFYAPIDVHTDENKKAVRNSNIAIGELQDADIIVVSTPMWNFTIPSVLKAWIDHIARAGITFRYTETGVEGLISGKKVYLAISSGNIYSEGPFKAHDFVEPYLRTIFRFIGLHDITTFRVEGTALPHFRDSALQKGIDSIIIH